MRRPLSGGTGKRAGAGVVRRLPGRGLAIGTRNRPWPVLNSADNSRARRRCGDAAVSPPAVLACVGFRYGEPFPSNISGA